MAFNYQGAATAGGNNTNPGVTHGLTINSGDEVFLHLNYNDSSGSITPTQGTGAAWELVTSWVPSGETCQQAVWKKVANGAEPTVFSAVVGTAAEWELSCIVFRPDSALQLDSAVNTHVQTGNATSLVCGAANGRTVADNSISLVFGGKDNRGGDEAYTTGDNSYTVAAGNKDDQASAIAYREYTTGETISGDITLSTADASDNLNDKTYSIHVSYVEVGSGTITPDAVTLTLTANEPVVTGSSNFNVAAVVLSLVVNAPIITTLTSGEVMAEVTAKQGIFTNDATLAVGDHVKGYWHTGSGAIVLGEGAVSFDDTLSVFTYSFYDVSAGGPWSAYAYAAQAIDDPVDLILSALEPTVDSAGTIQIAPVDVTIDVSAFEPTITAPSIFINLPDAVDFVVTANEPEITKSSIGSGVGIPISRLLKRWNRGTINHDKVLIVYDSSDLSGDDQQSAIATAYKNAWGLALDTYPVDLTNSTAKNQVAMWSSWLSGLATYCTTNGVEAICAPTTFGNTAVGQEGTFQISATGGRVSAVNVLGAVLAIKELMDNASGTELTDITANMDSLISYAWTDFQYDASGNLDETALSLAGDYFGGRHMTSPVNASRYTGLGAVGTLNNPDVLSIDEVSYSGVDFSSYLNTTLLNTDWKKQDMAQSCYPADNHAASRASLWLPCWRIGFLSGESETTTFTVADCQAMVARSKSAKQPIASHLNKTVLTVPNTRTAGSESVLTVSNYCVFDAMATDLGFNTVFGYVNGNTTATDLNQVNTDTGIAKYTTAQSDLFQNNSLTPGSGDTYRGYDSDAHRLFTQNGNEFPFSNVMLSYETLLTNASYSVFNDFYSSGANQGVSLATGAIGTDSTSASTGHASAFIQNGGSAFYGSLEEPLAEEDVNNGTAFMTKLLRGATAAEAAFGLNGESISFHELMGDGLAQPFYLQSTVNDMIVYKSEEAICYSKASGNERGRGLADDSNDLLGDNYRVEIPDSSGTTQAVIVGYMEKWLKSGLHEFTIIFDEDNSPAIDNTTTPDWPSYLTATYECIAGTLTIDSSTVWDSKTIVTDAGGKEFASFKTISSLDYFRQQLDSATTGVESHAETAGAVHDAADAGVTYTISGTPTAAGTDHKVVYNDTAKHGPFRLEDTALNGITIQFPTPSMGSAATTTFTTTISDDIVITDYITVTYSNSDITTGGGTSKIIDHNIIG